MRIIISLGFLAAVVVVWMFDAIAIIRGENGNTVSRTVFEWSAQWPIIPFGIGVVVGHLLWPNH